jgi:hypothetical protein
MRDIFGTLANPEQEPISFAYQVRVAHECLQREAKACLEKEKSANAESTTESATSTSGANDSPADSDTPQQEQSEQPSEPPITESHAAAPCAATQGETASTSPQDA